MKIFTLALSAMLLSTTVSAADLSAVPAGKYYDDPTHAYINLQYNHLGLSNPTLGFDDFKVTLDLDNNEPENSSVEVEITTASILTGSAIFHEHITGGKWFDAANHPMINFTSAAVTANADGTYNVTGDLTIKENTKPVMMVVTVNAAMMHPMANKPVVGISAVAGLKRSDWGLGANAPYVSDDVKLQIQVEMMKGD